MALIQWCSCCGSSGSAITTSSRVSRRSCFEPHVCPLMAVWLGNQFGVSLSVGPDLLGWVVLPVAISNIRFDSYGVVAVAHLPGQSREFGNKDFDPPRFSS
jgi:hypothetical protein